MASRVSVINRALQHHGAKRVVAATDTVLSKEINVMYEDVRDAELQKNWWRFSILRAQLAASATDPVWHEDSDAKIYPYPTDFLRLVEVKDRPPYTLEKQGIVCAVSSPLYIRYIERVTDESRFDPLFAECLSASLAYNVTEHAKSSADDKTRMFNYYQEILLKAVQVAAIELPPVNEEEDEWITARL